MSKTKDKKASSPITLSSHDIRRVAVAAGVDPRTVIRRLRGQKQACTTVARLDAALRSLGFDPPSV